jgi:signal transduction histidine kinase
MAGAIAGFSSAFDAAMASGQLRSAITLAENLGIACSSVNDHENALRWVQTARDLVQPTGWPFITAWTLMQTASVLVGLGRPAEAKTWLEQGLPLFAGHEGTRNHVLAQQVMGEACLALGEDAQALAWLQAALAAARSLDQGDLIVSTQRQHALALARLQRLDEALAAAQDGLDVAQARGDTRRVALMQHTLACIARDHGLPAPAGSPHANGCIHHLQAAWRRARPAAASRPTGLAPGLATAYEAVGQLQPALAHERAAAAAHQRLHTQRSDALLQTLLVRHQTEQARAEAAAQGLRAQLLEAQATLQRERAETMLAHAGKLVAMGRLVAGAVHEMGHPVGTMGLLAESLHAASGNWPPEAREAAGTLAGEARRLQRFIQRLRDFARAEPLHLQPHRLAQVLQDAQAIYRPRLVLERVQFTAPAAQVLAGLWVLADAERLALVLANLAFNAADAMAGRRRTATATGPAGATRYRHLHLDDSGPGLSPEVLARLFEPFFTTKPEGQGLGWAWH